MSGDLHLRTNYTSDIKLITDTIITEYDIKSAGMNILFDLGLISESLFNDLKNMDKLDRNVYIGKMLRNNKEMNKSLNDGFKLARELFFKNNNLNDSDILSIKKDAIFVIGKKCNNLRISNNIEFIENDEYDNYINILGKEHYINLYNEEIVVKGYHKEAVKHHKKYLFNFLIECLWENKKKDKKDLYIKLLLFKNNYISNNLDYRYYYDIIEEGYRIKSGNFIYNMEDINGLDLNEINLDKSNNLSFIVDTIRSFT